MRAIIILTISFINFSFGQNVREIDSTFYRNFKIVDFELFDGHEIDVFFFQKLDLGDGEFGYINQFIFDAITFFEEITSIQAPIKRNRSSYIKPYQSYVDYVTVQKWRQWYFENKENLIWSEELQKPILICED